MSDDMHCRAVADCGYLCTLNVGHDDSHEAWGFTRLYAVWDDDGPLVELHDL